MENLTDKEISYFKDAFDAFDKEQDGMVTAKELNTILRAIGREPTEMELQALINEVDGDGNGSIDFHEFANTIAAKLHACDQDDELRETFKIFDKNNNGAIGATDFRAIVNAMGININDEEIDELIREADTDGDGQLNFEEFVAMMTTIV